MRLRLTCREVTTLVLRDREQPMGRWERTVLHLHWLACDGCRQFRRQTALLHQAMGQWRRYRDDPGAADDAAAGGDPGATPPR